MTSQKTLDAQDLLDLAGDRGLTGREYAAMAEVTPGSASGLLSRMHLSGHAVRLLESRDGGGIYVHPDRVHGRPTVERGEKSQAVADGAVEPAVEPEEVDLADEIAGMREMMGRQLAHARAEAKEAGIAQGWNEGYDEGIKRGVEQSADRTSAFAEGRVLGRAEGEDHVRARVNAVAVEMHRVIVETAPVRTHFKGCYKVHPECAIRALGRAAGITQRPIGLSAAG